MTKFIEYMQAWLLAGRKEDERGATMVEYGLMVALIAVIVAVAVAVLGQDIAAMFNGVAAQI